MKHGHLPTLPLLDIHQAAFLEMHGHEPCLTKEGTRIIFEFMNSPEVLAAVQAFNRNPSIKLLDYVSHLRSLRARMYSAR
jgi:hypothetical protein